MGNIGEPRRRVIIIPEPAKEPIRPTRPEPAREPAKEPAREPVPA
jgi:hypothetical protein